MKKYRFATFIEHTSRHKALKPAWLSDLIRYEKVWLLASAATRGVTIYRSRYAIEKLIWSLEHGEEAPIALKRPTVVLWLRITSRAQLKYYRFSLPDLASTTTRGRA